MSLAPAAAPPTLVKYQLMGEIGHGGMATVYRARDVRLGREVAVKVIHPHLRENKEVAARFVAEAQAVAKLRHPGIVEVFDVSDAGDTERFLVAELVRGPSLRRIVEQHKEIPPEIGACFGVLLCEALGHAHDAGIVHRDVKPENVLVELDEPNRTAHVKLTDFGIAKILDAQGVTSTGQVLGSPAHMAPEQIEGGAVDVRTDVFSLGVLIYECMTGRLPFEGKNPAQVLRKVLDCIYSPAEQLRPTVGARWSAILCRAISREPDERYADIREFRAALKIELAASGIHDVTAEVFEFLRDADGYRDRFAKGLIPRLVERAKKLRDAGDIPGAAADLNRAVAYAPDDAELLVLVTSLARGQRRRRILQRAIVASALVVVVGGIAFGAARAYVLARRQHVIPTPVAVGSVAAVDASATVGGDAEAPPTSGPSASVVVVPRIKVSPIRGGPPEVNMRDVWIMARPPSALVSVDGDPPTPVSFGKGRRLSVGKHVFLFTVDPANKCCEPSKMELEITADNGKGGPFNVMGSLKMRQANVSLAGGPAEGRLVCPMVQVNIGLGQIAAVDMQSPERTVQCLFDGPGITSATQSVAVALHAGAPSVVRWPAP